MVHVQNLDWMVWAAEPKGWFKTSTEGILPGLCDIVTSKSCVVVATGARLYHRAGILKHCHHLGTPHTQQKVSHCWLWSNFTREGAEHVWDRSHYGNSCYKRPCPPPCPSDASAENVVGLWSNWGAWLHFAMTKINIDQALTLYLPESVPALYWVSSRGRHLWSSMTEV